MKLLVDMNLSLDWLAVFRAAGVEAVHWSQVGDPSASDTEVMDWARGQGAIVFTHDLDFGTALALTQSRGPSVVQVRSQDVSPGNLGPMVILLLNVHREHLEKGALLVVDQARGRIRLLPISPDRA